MGHRQLPNTNPKPEVNHGESWNSSRPPHSFHTGSSSSVIHMENSAVNGLSTMPYFNSTIMSNEHPSCSITNPRPHVSVAGYPHNPYNLQSASGCPVQFPSNYFQPGFPSYMSKMSYGERLCSLDPVEESGRCHSKARKKGISIAYDPANTNGYHSARTTDIPGSSDHFHQMSIPNSQAQPWDADAANSNRKGKRLLINGEGSHRNVRPKYPDVQLDPSHGGTGLFSNHYNFSRGIPAPSMRGKWNYNTVSMPSNGGILSPDAGFTNHVMNKPGTSNHSCTMGENLNALPPIGSSTTRIGVNNNYGDSASQAHGFKPCFPPSRIHSTSLHDNGRLGPEGFFRHSVPLSFSGTRSRERHGRVRSSYGRFQPFPVTDNSHRRWTSEGIFSMNRSNFHDSRSLYDQYRDMRLDIDNMSYEDLLALEERIGSVNTGLSDNVILKCVTKIIYCSLDQAQEKEEGNCVICLENFKDGEELGFLKCTHGYHVNCIKQWLQIKNACPICKSSALEI